jgi:Ca-activated chloride channel homolog
MKAARAALLAATQLCWVLLGSGTACALDARAAWSDLWRTPDQQGQALLDAGQPAQAAERFHDPRRRAYADFEAGRYQDAAKLLAPFTDTRSEYNRGNALAETGQLQEALATYDAALKQAPDDEDIRHNRDLVEQQLRQRQHSTRSTSRNGRQGSQGSGASGQQQGGAGQRSGSGSQQSGASGSQSAGSGQTASNGSPSSGNQTGNSGQPGGGGIQSGAGGPQAAGASGSGSSTESPGQAQRDAALAANFARQRQQQGAAGNLAQAQGSQQNGSPGRGRNGAGQGPDSGLLAGGTQTPKQKPETERQLALDQWLRQIPDSPAGLLQRKFLIEHMMKQQDSEEPQGGNQ